MEQELYKAIVNVKDLEKIGINSQKIISEYQLRKGVTLNLNEMIKVSSQDEGQTIDFKTLDEISIRVHVNDSDGSPNKIDPPEEI